jgi:dTDP-4-dehydrorhamnose reductase
MIVLLGASGYIGQAFAQELTRRKLDFIPLSRKQVDYSRFDVLRAFLQDKQPAFLINAAGYAGKPNVDACELAKADTLAGDTLLPQTIAHACAVARVPWGHVSSGCIYDGAKINEDGRPKIVTDLTKPEIKSLLETNRSAIHGFSESDRPNFTFRQQTHSFYSGSKALAEEAISTSGQTYLWRLRIPFDEFDNSRNYLSKVQRYAKVYDNVNSISHRGDFVRACLDLWERRAPFGTYNVTNPGFVTTREVVALIEKFLKPPRKFEFWKSNEEFYEFAAKTPRSNCVLDVSKLLAAGVKIRPVDEALEHSLRNWKSEDQSSTINARP